VVVGVAQLTPRMRRITVQADAMCGVVAKPAQDVELLLRDDSGRRVKRRYTIRHARPDKGELDLDVLLHGGGPGAQWGRRAAQGDRVEFQGPRGKLELRGAALHLLVGDESALPAIAAISEALPPAERAIAVVEIATAADPLPIDAETHWVPRGATAAGGAELLTAALQTIGVATNARGYLLGETRAMVALRAVLESYGVDHDAIFVKGYWNLGRAVGRTAGSAA
jgi:NADPH-dependent ferric siderophore reductase